MSNNVQLCLLLYITETDDWTSTSFILLVVLRLNVMQN